jgi:hypothetical protein
VKDADDDAARRRRAWGYRGVLVCWYGVALLWAVVAGLACAGSPLPAAVYVFVPFELATIVTAAGVDDWDDDFRGEYEVLTRGTVANLVVAAISVCISIR